MPKERDYATYTADGQTRYYYYVGDFYDVEKTQTDDIHRCWSASLSGTMYYSGWGKIHARDAGGVYRSMNTEDDLFAYLSENLIYEWCYARDTFEWLLSGKIDSKWLLDKNFVGGGFYPQADTLYYYFGRAYNATIGSTVLDGIVYTLRGGGGVYLAIGWYNDETNEQTGNHVLSAWGYEVDPTKSPNDPDYYTALYIADPDSSMKWSSGAIDELTRMPIRWDASVGQYRFDNGARIRINGFAWIDAMPDAYLSGPRETPSCVVTTLKDVVNPTDGLISIREAILYASEGGTVTFDSSRIAPNSTIDLASGSLAIKKSLTIDASALWNQADDKPGLTINAGGKSRVFNTVNNVLTSKVTLIGLEITGGRVAMESTDNAAASAFGGGIYNDADLTLVDCVVTGNETSAISVGTKAAYSAGGGIFNAGTLTVCDTSITGNCSEARTVDGSSYAYGGGVCNQGIAVFKRSIIAENNARSESTASGYASVKGGGIINSGTLTLEDADLSGNRGIAIAVSGDAVCYGGGMRNSGTASIFQILIAGNLASGKSASSSANGYGGGISNNKDSVSLTLTQSTVAGNLATSYGGGIYNWNLLTVTNSIISGNREGTATPSDLRTNTSAGTSKISYSLITSVKGKNYVTEDAASVLTSVSPAFVSFSARTSAAWTSDAWQGWNLRLKSSSPAMNAGANALAVGMDGQPLTKDKDGKRRTDAGRVDLGVFEFQSMTALSAPTGLTASCRGRNSVTLTWNPVAGASGYRVVYSDNGQTWREQKTASSSLSISGLTFGQTLTYLVYALGDNLAYADSADAAILEKVFAPGDFNGDGRVNLSDYAHFTRAWRANTSSSRWNPVCDLNADGLIDDEDFNILAENWLRNIYQ